MKKGWENKRLADCCEIVNGGTPKSSVVAYWGGEHSWVTPAEMGGLASPYLGTTRRTLTNAGLKNSSARLLPPQSVILSSRAPIGHLVINTVPMATNQGCKGLVPRAGLEALFLYYCLLGMVPQLDAMGTGATFKELSAGKLKEVCIPVPPLPEQRRIVAILNEAFEGIAAAKANAERNLRNAKEACDAASASRLEQSTADCPVWTVADLAEHHKGSIRTGPFGSQLLHSEFVDDGVAVLGIDNAVANEFQWGKRRFITREKYRSLQRYTAKPGDVVITIMGTCGRCAVIPDNIPLSINSKHLCCISLDQRKCLPTFLHAYFLAHPGARQYLAEQASGSIMDGLNMGIIREMPVQLPDIEVQRETVAALQKLQCEATNAAMVFGAKAAALDELKASLLHQAFTGQL